MTDRGGSPAGRPPDASTVPVAAATGTVLAYRVITVWLPLLPGALVLGVLVRRGIV